MLLPVAVAFTAIKFCHCRSCSAHDTMSSASSHSAPPPIVTRRELSLLSAAQLWALASAHGLLSSGRKSALIDRLYCLRNQQSTAAAQASSHDSSSSRSASPDSGSRSRSRSRHRSRRHCPHRRLVSCEQSSASYGGAYETWRLGFGVPCNQAPRRRRTNLWTTSLYRPLLPERLLSSTLPQWCSPRPSRLPPPRPPRPRHHQFSSRRSRTR